MRHLSVRIQMVDGNTDLQSGKLLALVSQECGWVELRYVICAIARDAMPKMLFWWDCKKKRQPVRAGVVDDA